MPLRDNMHLAILGHTLWPEVYIAANLLKFIYFCYLLVTKHDSYLIISGNDNSLMNS